MRDSFDDPSGSSSSHPQLHHRVVCVLVDFDGDLWAVSRTRHVWLVNSAHNDAAARLVWAREHGGPRADRGVTVFDSIGTRLDDLLDVLGTIAEHHPNWDAIDVRGLDLEDVDRDAITARLGDAEARLIGEAGGFVIVRTGS